MSDGVSNFPTDTRYYDTYVYATDDEHYNRRILGDATGEMGPFTDRRYGSQTIQVGSWHDDEAWFVGSGNPWFLRSGSHTYGSTAGVFGFDDDYGSGLSWVSFRVVLSV